MAEEATEHTTLTFKDRLLYGLGHFGISLLGYMVVACVVPFYNPPENELATTGIRLVASATLIAAILFFTRMIDFVADPLIGYLSDRTRTRWGRRKPFMVVSAPLLAVVFVLLWHPPVGHASNANAWYAGAMLTAVFLMFAGFVAPYLALLPEVARGRQERVRLATVQGIFNLLGTAVAAVGVGLLTPRFGFAPTALVLSALCLLAMWASCFGPGEHHRETPSETTPHLPLREATRRTIGNVPFLIYWAGYYLFLSSLLVILAGMEFISSGLINLPAGASGGISAVALLGGLLFLPLSKRLTERHGSRWSFLAGLVWLALTLPLFALLGLWGDPVSVVWQARLLALLLSPAVAVLYTVPYTILADICDLDFKHTGSQRGAMYFGFQGTMMKGGWGIAPLIAALVMQVLGTEQPLQWGYRLMGPVAGAMALVGFLIFRFYPEKRIQGELQESENSSGIS